MRVFIKHTITIQISCSSSSASWSHFSLGNCYWMYIRWPMAKYSIHFFPKTQSFPSCFVIHYIFIILLPSFSLFIDFISSSSKATKFLELYWHFTHVGYKLYHVGYLCIIQSFGSKPHPPYTTEEKHNLVKLTWICPLIITSSAKLRSLIPPLFKSCLSLLLSDPYLVREKKQVLWCTSILLLSWSCSARGMSPHVTSQLVNMYIKVGSWVVDPFEHVQRHDYFVYHNYDSIVLLTSRHRLPWQIRTCGRKALLLGCLAGWHAWSS